jgi:hypothetical protein
MSEILEAVAYHEAGHAVAHFVFGFYTDYVTIIPNEVEGSLGCASLMECDEREGENHAISCLAGYAAQCRFDPSSEADALEGAHHDFGIAQKALLAVGVKPDLDIWLKYLDKAKTFVAEEWIAIDALAKELLIWKELDDVEVDLIIEAARSGETAEAQEFREGLERYRTDLKPNKVGAVEEADELRRMTEYSV